MAVGGIDSREIAVPVDLDQAGPFLNNMAQTIEDELIKLRNLLQPVLDSWDGENKRYYEGLQLEWNVAAEGLLGPQGVLGQIAHAMNVTWQNYTDCEWTNVQTWKH
ncbi:WXG100 family type VII secretion target [Micromonospora sp. NPDC049366]|uniref:WXG100 family type VII secretion target n=1 Tax=Micromonospora sp. NPDC049366 TaxID=3364271 RepID=UPI0037BB6A13